MSDWVYMMSDWVYMMSEYDEWMSVYDEWMSVYDEWMSVYDEWMSVYEEWMRVYGEWMQWVLGVCKDMNVECVWRMLGECRCARLQNKCLLRYTCTLLWVTIYNICIGLFENKLSNCIIRYFTGNNIAVILSRLAILRYM